MEMEDEKYIHENPAFTALRSEVSPDAIRSVDKMGPHLYRINKVVVASIKRRTPYEYTGSPHFFFCLCIFFGCLDCIFPMQGNLQVILLGINLGFLFNNTICVTLSLFPFWSRAGC